MDHIVESESEDESRSKNDDNLGLIAADDASLTLEDQQDIQQLQEDRISNLDNIGRRTRSNQVDLNPGLGEMIQIIESEGGEDDLLDDISDDDSFAFQDLGNSGMNSELSDEGMEDEMDESMEIDMSSDGSDGGIDGQSDIIINNLQQANEQSQDSENEDEMEDNDMEDPSDDDDDSADDGFDDMEDNGSFGSYGEYGDEDENSNEIGQGERDRSEIMSFSQDPYYEEEDEEELSGEYSERGFRRVRNEANIPLPVSDENTNSLRPDINVLLNSSAQINHEQQILRALNMQSRYAHQISRQRSRSRSFSSNSNSQSMNLNVADLNVSARQNQRQNDGLVKSFEEINKLLQSFTNLQASQINQIQTRQTKKNNEQEQCLNVLQSLQSLNVESLSISNKQKLFNLIFSCLNCLVDNLNQKLKMDQNLYISNMMVINQDKLVGEQALQTLDEFQRGTSLIDQINNMNQKTGDNTNSRDTHPPNTSDSRLDKNELVELTNLNGYNEYVKSMKVLLGEEMASPNPHNQNKEQEDEQIQEQRFDNAFDQIDPLFTEALNADSIRIVKENDQLIKNIQKQSTAINQAQISTINDFLKKQTPEIRQQLLKNLDAHIITYLSSDLYTEAKRVRQQANPPAPPQPPVGPQGQNAQRVRASANARRATQAQRALPGARQMLGVADSVVGGPQPTRNRFLSVDSQTINIDSIAATSKPGQRDSESEDITIPQQKSNFHPNAFFFNIHTYMKENMEGIKNMIIKNYLRNNGAYILGKQGQIQNADQSKKKNTSKSQSLSGNLQQIYTNEDLENFCEKLVFEQFNPESPDSTNMNISSITGMIDLAITEIICSKANMQSKKVSPGQLLQKLRVISQIPNFRIGLMVKIIQIMSKEMQGLRDHIQNQLNIQKGQIIPPTMVVYEGVTKIWDYLTSDQPVLLGPKKCLSFFLSYLQNLEALEILKKPENHPILLLLFKEFQMNSKNQTLLDQILSMILDYIELLCNHPEAFEFQESQEKDYNRWKQEILQQICMILYQINVSLNILKRKDLSKSQIQDYQKEYSLSNETVNKIFKILFFIDQDDDKHKEGKKNQSIFLDKDKKSIKMVSQVLSRISMLPLGVQGDSENLLDLSPLKDKQKQQNLVVPKKLGQIINNYMSSFSTFFDKKFRDFDKNSQSILSCSSKLQQQKLSLIIEKILHIFKISINLSFIKNNICEDEYLNSCLRIVQKIIENEEQFEMEQSGMIIDEGAPQKQTYLFKEEFKLIMQLIFTLSEYDLKTVEGPAADKRKQGEPVSIQSLDLMKATFKEQVAEQRTSSNQTQDDKSLLNQILVKFQGAERVQDLIRFFFKNKGLINKFIRINQSSISEQFQGIVNKVPEILDFDSKRLLWRVLIKKTMRKNQQDDGFEIDIGVRRNQVFGDSFEQLKDIQLSSWKQKFTIEFHDEEGVDEGGLTKEWFQLISQGIFDPNYALFCHIGKGSTYYPNPNSVVHEKEEMIELFKFVGRIIGKALCEGQLLDCYFVKALYKMMLGQPLILSDLEDFDSQLYNSLVYMLENDADMLCQTFVLSSKFFDEDKDVELKENGKEIDVTNENKFEYVQLVLHYRLYSCIKTQIDAFLQGFHELVPLNLIKIFDFRELELLISGLPTVDIQDLKENVMYKNYSKQSKVIQWLWEVLEEFNNTEKAEFIQFVTGSSKVPVEGFKGLRGTNGIQKVELVKLVCDKPDQRLPQAHTCFFQLDLPDYSSKDVLRNKLYMAIKEGKTFNIA